jgi:hypothetical protein
MKVAILSESPADEAAIRILVEGLLGRPIQVAVPSRLRPGGWPHVLDVLPKVLLHLHYNTDAEGLVVVVDSNDSPVHVEGHDKPGAAVEGCRTCRLRQALVKVQAGLRPVRAPVKVAVGLAAPAIEAWYRCGIDPNISEGAWARGLQSGQYPYTKNGLKRDTYGTDRPSLSRETSCAIEQAQRLAGDLQQLERKFPNGFGALARQVRSW